MPLTPGDVFLDLGCGAGGPTIWIAESTGASGIGVDGSVVALESAQRLAHTRRVSDRMRFVHADLTATGLGDSSVDGVMSIDSLMFVDPFAASAEIARVLRVGKKAVVRVVESVVEPFTPTIVADYRPIFSNAGLTTVRHEEVHDYRSRSVAFFRAIAQRADSIRSEIGSLAEILISDATDSLEKASRPPRVRTVYIEMIRER